MRILELMAAVPKIMIIDERSEIATVLARA
jgi:hypothetical protein